eukprot:6454306-Prymnesium_polylepis.1
MSRSPAPTMPVARTERCRVARQTMASDAPRAPFCTTQCPKITSLSFPIDGEPIQCLRERYYARISTESIMIYSNGCHHALLPPRRSHSTTTPQHTSSTYMAWTPDESA